MNINIIIKKALPFILILLMLMIIIPQSFATDDSSLGNISADNSQLGAISSDSAMKILADSRIDYAADASTYDLKVAYNTTIENSNDVTSDENKIYEKSVKAGSYDYVSSPSEDTVVYINGENRNVTVSIDADLNNLEKMEGEPFYVWVNGEGENNKVSIYNIFLMLKSSTMT